MVVIYQTKFAHLLSDQGVPVRRRSSENSDLVIVSDDEDCSSQDMTSSGLDTQDMTSHGQDTQDMTSSDHDSQDMTSPGLIIQEVTSLVSENDNVTSPVHLEQDETLIEIELCHGSSPETEIFHTQCSNIMDNSGSNQGSNSDSSKIPIQLDKPNDNVDTNFNIMNNSGTNSGNNKIPVQIDKPNANVDVDSNLSVHRRCSEDSHTNGDCDLDNSYCSSSEGEILEIHKTMSLHDGNLSDCSDSPLSDHEGGTHNRCSTPPVFDAADHADIISNNTCSTLDAADHTGIMDTAQVDVNSITSVENDNNMDDMGTDMENIGNVDASVESDDNLYMENIGNEWALTSNVRTATPVLNDIVGNDVDSHSTLSDVMGSPETHSIEHTASPVLNDVVGNDVDTQSTYSDVVGRLDTHSECTVTPLLNNVVRSPDTFSIHSDDDVNMQNDEDTSNTLPHIENNHRAKEKTSQKSPIQRSSSVPIQRSFSADTEDRSHGEKKWGQDGLNVVSSQDELENTSHGEKPGTLLRALLSTNSKGAVSSGSDIVNEDDILKPELSGSVSHDGDVLIISDDDDVDDVILPGHMIKSDVTLPGHMIKSEDSNDVTRKDDVINTGVTNELMHMDHIDDNMSENNIELGLSRGNRALKNKESWSKQETSKDQMQNVADCLASEQDFKLSPDISMESPATQSHVTDLTEPVRTSSSVLQHHLAGVTIHQQANMHPLQQPCDLDTLQPLRNTEPLQHPAIVDSTPSQDQHPCEDVGTIHQGPNMHPLQQPPHTVTPHHSPHTGPLQQPSDMDSLQPLRNTEPLQHPAIVDSSTPSQEQDPSGDVGVSWYNIGVEQSDSMAAQTLTQAGSLTSSAPNSGSTQTLNKQSHFRALLTSPNFPTAPAPDFPAVPQADFNSNSIHASLSAAADNLDALRQQNVGHPSNQTLGHPSNQTPGHPLNQTPGHPSDQTLGHPSNPTDELRQQNLEILQSFDIWKRRLLARRNSLNMSAARQRQNMSNERTNNSAERSAQLHATFGASHQSVQQFGGNMRATINTRLRHRAVTHGSVRNIPAPNVCVSTMNQYPARGMTSHGVQQNINYNRMGGTSHTMSNHTAGAGVTNMSQTYQGNTGNQYTQRAQVPQVSTGYHTPRHLPSHALGHPSIQTPGHPSNQTLGHPSNQAPRHTQNQSSVSHNQQSMVHSMYQGGPGTGILQNDWPAQGTPPPGPLLGPPHGGPASRGPPPPYHYYPHQLT